MARKATNRLIDLADAGMLLWRDVAIMALKWMSEDDVADMMKANDLCYNFYDDDEEAELDAMYHDC